MPWSLRMVLYAGIILFIILIYFGFRYFRSIKISNLQHSWLYNSFYFLTAVLFLAYPVSGLIEFFALGSFSRTAYPDFLIYLFWFGLVYMGLMINWLLLHDLLLPVAKKFKKNNPDEISRKFAFLFLILALLTLVSSAGIMIWDTNRITIEEIQYTIPDNDEPFEPLTIVHIADLHADDYTLDTQMGRYISRINSFNPDIVIFAGDLITSGTGHIVNGANALGRIEATYGTFAVLGDHDYWTDTDQIISELNRNGIPVLHNENVWIDHIESAIKLTGITEIYSSRVQTDSLSALLNESRGEQLKLLATHQASDRLIEQSVSMGVHQLLGGHTHGGQIRIPIFFYPVTAVRAETRYVNGNWLLDDMLLNINNGLGFTLAPVRFNAPAQVSVIYVNSRNSD